ncbi:hypothetical protein LCGC14_0615820 [marine sediment metagenome]|uniref:Uncharacterized protein n=1 Tax=marine sediment metagenome TaxID=412755 RepID=A0A0F9UER8_9ZZZZ
MTLEDLIIQLAVYLPHNSEFFTDTYSIRVMKRLGDEFEIELDRPHNLSDGKVVTIVETQSRIPISSFTRIDTVGTVVTSIDHDLTKPISPKVTVLGSANFEFNGEFTVLNIQDKNTITVLMSDSIPSDSGGGSVLLNAGGVGSDYNNTYEVSRTTSDTSFAVNDGRSTTGQPFFDSESQIRARPRIGGGVDLEGFIKGYKNDKQVDWWMFCFLEDVFASKDRNLRTDSIQDSSAGEFFRQITIQPFTLYVMKNVSGDALARQARDDCETMFQGICKSILMHRFDSQFGVGEQGHVHFMNHGRAHFDGAIYVHAFSFQQTCDLSDRDTVRQSPDVAFKQFSLELAIKDGTEVETMQTANVQIIVPQ